MNIINKLNWRYATKKFDETKELSSTKLNILKEAFNLTPTSYGLQTIKMLVVNNHNLKEKFVEICYDQKQISQASHILVICIQDKVDEEDVDAFFDTIKKIRKTPELILSKYRKEQKEFLNSKTQEQIEAWCKNQAYISLGNLMTVCAIEGIDACPMEGFIPKKVDKLLNLETLGLKSVLLLPVGYRAHDDMFAEFKKVRKNLSETIIDL